MNSEQRSREGTVPVRSSRFKSTPSDRAQTTQRGPSTDQINHSPFTRSNPSLNDAQHIRLSDLSDQSNSSEQYAEQNFFSAPNIQTRLLEVRIPLDEKLDYSSGISIVGGSDTPLRAIFIQSIH